MSRSIKILQLAKHFHPDTGGIEILSKSIADMLPKHGIQADVLCTATDRNYPALDVPYRVYRCAPGLRFGGNKSLSFGYAKMVAQLSSDYDAAIVHMPNPVAAAAALVGWRKPLILLWHADIPQPVIRMLGAPLDIALARKASAVIGLTPIHIAESHRASSLMSKGVVIGYPFDRTRLPQATGDSDLARQVKAFARGRDVALSIGRLVPYKGFDVLIEASRHFDGKLVSVIVGSGPLLQTLRDKIEQEGAADRVMLAGPASDAELADILDLCHVGCMPSVTAAEMYGVAQVEAFAFGKPVVSTRLPRSGVTYVNKHDVTGLIVEPGDSRSLADALKRLSDDEHLYQRLAAGARASFATEHDIDAISQRYADLIRGVVNRNWAPRPFRA